MRIDKYDLAPKLSKLKAAIPSKTTNECMQGILLYDGQLIANNIEVGMTAKLGVNTGERFIIPSKAIDYILKLPDGPVEITTDSKHILTIKAAGSKVKHQSFDPESFIRIPKQDEVAITTMEGPKFAAAVSAVLYASGVNMIERPVMESVYIKGNGVKLLFIASDGYRVAIAEVESTEVCDMIIPRSSMQKIMGIDLKGSIAFEKGKSTLTVRSGDFELVTRLLEGSFPNMERILVSEKDTAVKIKRSDLLESIERVNIMIDTAAVLVNFGNEIVISGISATSEFSEKINMENPAANTKELGLNHKYLGDVLKNMKDEFITIKYDSNSDLSGLFYFNQNETEYGLILPVKRR